MDIGSALQNLSIAFIPVMLGIILHEVAHGYVASKLGDDTAKLQGRLTLNPIVHIDPMGFLVFILTAIAAPFTFGWAKPVPINPRNFKSTKDIKTEMMLVALAGPLANLLLAIVCAIIFKLLLTFTPEFFLGTVGFYAKEMLQTGIVANLVLMLINLFPIPPFDGSHVVAKFLSSPNDYKYMSFAKYGFLILVMLLFLGVVDFILRGFLNVVLPLIADFLMW